MHRITNKTIITLAITTICVVGYFAIPNGTDIVLKASILESPQRVQKPEYKESQQNTGIVSTDMVKSHAMDSESGIAGNTANITTSGGTRQAEPKELGSAPPVEVYFLESKFGVYDTSECGDGTYQSSETPCRTVPEKLTKAVSTALEMFHKIVGKDFDEDEFFKIFMIDEVTGQFKETLDGNLHLTPDDPIESGEKLAKAYTDAEKLRKR